MTDPALPPSPAGTFPWLRALAVGTVAVMALAGTAAGTCAYRYITAPKVVEDTIVVRDTPNVVVAVRDLARLESASYHMERIVNLADKQEHLFGLVTTEDAMLLVAAGDVAAGVDLTELRDGDVVIDPDNHTARIVLPPPRVFSTRLDNKNTYVYSRRTDTLAKRREDLESRARSEAERTLEKAAVATGILDRAKRNATTTITALVKSLGYDKVDVTFRKE